MRTTIDLPDDLLRRARATAERRGLTLKALLTSLLERELAAAPAPADTHKRGHSRPLPELLPRTGVPVPSLTSAEVEDILLREDLDRSGKASGIGGDGPS